MDSLYVSAWESGRESVFAIIMSVIFLGQSPTSWELIGSAVVVIGLLYYNYYTGLAEEEGKIMSYKVSLRSFEGPFDLLVYLIENAQMSIYDIRISEITSQYLDYIDRISFGFQCSY